MEENTQIKKPMVSFRRYCPDQVLEVLSQSRSDGAPSTIGFNAGTGLVPTKWSFYAIVFLVR